MGLSSLASLVALLLLLACLTVARGWSRSARLVSTSRATTMLFSGSSGGYQPDTEADFTELLADMVVSKEEDPDDTTRRKGVPFPEQIRELKRNEQENPSMEGVDDSLRKFYTSARAGLACMVSQDLGAAVKHFDDAVGQNSSQPLVQRGIALYLLGRFEEAAQQLQRDITTMERNKLYRASDMRIWLSACFNRLGKEKDAQTALGLNTYNADGSIYVESRFLLQNLLAFYGGQLDLVELMDIIGRVDEADVTGTIFYGNFYVGMYFDSKGDEAMARAFLSIPCRSNKYGPTDVWHHVPRLLCQQRGYIFDQE